MIKLLLICFTLVSMSNINAQNTYYISSSQGNDSNNGTSENTPWKTILKVNSVHFEPGDKILFKRGDKWAEGIGLIITSSGNSDNLRITYGAYGSGNKPEISLERVLTGTWINEGNNIWRLYISNHQWSERKLWLDEKSVKIIGSDYDVYADQNTKTLAATSNITSASQVQKLGPEYRWDSQDGFIDLYSTSNPSSIYNSIKTYYSIDCITLINVNYVTIENIKVTRCTNGIAVQGSSHITIDDVNAYDIYFHGIIAQRYGNKKTDYLEVKNSTLDSGIGDVEGIAYEYYFDRGNWGIALLNGTDYAKIHNNLIKNWHHSSIFVVANEKNIDSSTVNYNKIYDNTISMADINFGRFIEIHGAKNQAHDNRVYRNKIINQNSFCEISGYHNYIYYNLFLDVKLRGYYCEGERYVLQWLNTVDGGVNTDNYFFNNTIYNSPGSLSLDFGTRNNTFNNLVINYNDAQKWEIPVIELKTDAGNTIYRNNFFYSPYVNHNSNEIRYNSTWRGTINDWNSADINGDIIDKNKVLDSNPILQDGSYGLKAPIEGIDISPYVQADFTTDINGNKINITHPNVGAVDNSPQVSTGFKVFLEGPYNSNQMNTLLNDKSYIPLIQPYNINPWNYSGSESVSNVPKNIVDWVLVELRTSTSPSSVIAKRAAFLRIDGSITDLDGISPLTFDKTGSYYVVVKHRNHLAIMSSQPVHLINSTIQYDFTTSESKAYGSNSMADLGNGVYGMYGGDSDGNGIIENSDIIYVSQKLFNNGYFTEDLDMNSPVNVLDYKLPNINLSKASNVQ